MVSDVTMSRNMAFSVVEEYAAAEITVDADTTMLEAVSAPIAELTAALGTLKAALSEGAGESALDEATHAQNALLPAMDAVRAAADKLETVVADDLWPLPTYQEMLYIL